MASITITVPDVIATNVLLHFTNHYGYEEQVPNESGQLVPNPQSRQAFAKATLIDLIRDAVRIEEGRAAANTARDTAEATSLTTTSTIS